MLLGLVKPVGKHSASSKKNGPKKGRRSKSGRVLQVALVEKVRSVKLDGGEVDAGRRASRQSVMPDSSPEAAKE